MAKKKYTLKDCGDVSTAKWRCGANTITLAPTAGGQCVAYTTSKTLASTVKKLLGDYVAQRISFRDGVYSIVIEASINTAKMYLQ